MLAAVIAGGWRSCGRFEGREDRRYIAGAPSKPFASKRRNQVVAGAAGARYGWRKGAETGAFSGHRLQPQENGSGERLASLSEALNRIQTCVAGLTLVFKRHFRQTMLR